MAIHRTRFIRHCMAAGLKGGYTANCTFWRVPLMYVLVWDYDNESVCIVPNDTEALTYPTAHCVAVFTEPHELDAALATYNLLNP